MVTLEIVKFIEVTEKAIPYARLRRSLLLIALGEAERQNPGLVARLKARFAAFHPGQFKSSPLRGQKSADTFFCPNAINQPQQASRFILQDCGQRSLREPLVTNRAREPANGCRANGG